jgi:diguanylate cyclase (GGDEF)-like protein
LVDWTKLPDFVAVGLLTSAFASVARRGQTSLSGLWLLGWVMIMLHFGAYAFLSAPGQWSVLANFVGTIALVWAGLLFTWASVPYRKQASSFWIFLSLNAVSTLYLGFSIFDTSATWELTVAAALFGLLPLVIALFSLPRFTHPLRLVVVGLYIILSAFLMAVQLRPNGASFALNALLFTVYLTCAIHFWYGYPRATAGAFITIAGFFGWASVFIVGPIMIAWFPSFNIESEVWNLPKYVVAVGMILLLLEDQIEHNKYLALHDELTGLPNRRLFQDRLAITLERARRSGSHVALLQIDLNEFKQVNDTVGHHVGDELLKRVGNIFLGRVRRSDTVARTGGDEFSIILEEPMSRADASRVGASLTELLENPFEVNGHTVRVGASVGIAFFPDDASDAESLCIAADLRMYAGKQASKAKSQNEIQRPFRPASVPASNPQTGLRLAE